ncbi:MAG: ABC transporter substrate-binding protein [Tannerella sp.]|jgi:branched-chain amino acid transport system substrate-binding protein|nr:ABC transporter substrate-binding protein [Tannerella sp.]
MAKKIFITIGVIAVVAIGVLVYLNNAGRKQEVVRIGAILPLSGNLAQLGESGRTGLLLAEEYINSKNNNKKIKFLFEDGKANPTASINAANKLITLDKIDIVFSIISAVELSIVPIQEKEHFLMFSHSSHPQLSNVNDLFFRQSQTVQQESDFILSNIDSIATLTICYMSDDYGVAFEKEMQGKIQPNRIKSVVSFLPTESNFATIAKKAIDAKSDKIVICAGGKNIADFVKKLREQNYSGEIITTLAYIVSGANKNTKDVKNLSMIDFKKVTVDKEFEDFIHNYKTKTGEKIGTAELMFFNSAWIVYTNSINGNMPQQISAEIKNHTTQNILGNIVTITNTNDILPELEIIKQ